MNAPEREPVRPARSCSCPHPRTGREMRRAALGAATRSLAGDAGIGCACWPTRRPTSSATAGPTICAVRGRRARPGRRDRLRAGAGARRRRHAAAGAEFARAAGVPLLGVNLGRVGFLAEAEPERPRRGVDAGRRPRDYEVEERMTIDVLVRNDGEVRRPRLGAQRGARGEGAPRSGCSRSCWRSTAGRCRASAATACCAPPRPARPPTRSPPAARWCGRRSRRCCVVPISAHALFARPLVTSPDASVAIEVEPVRPAARAVLRRPAHRGAAAGARVEVGRGARAGAAGPAATPRRSPTGWCASSPCRCTGWRGAPHRRRRVAGRASAVGAGHVWCEPMLEEMRIRASGSSTTPRWSCIPGSPSSPARPARARPWSSPAWPAARRRGPTPAGCRLGAARAVVEGRSVDAPTGPRRRRGGCRGGRRPNSTTDGSAHRVRTRRSRRALPRARGRALACPSACSPSWPTLVAVHGQTDQQRLLRPGRAARRARPVRRRRRSPARSAQLPDGYARLAATSAHELTERTDAGPGAAPGGRPAAASGSPRSTAVDPQPGEDVALVAEAAPARARRGAARRRRDRARRAGRHRRGRPEDAPARSALLGARAQPARQSARRPGARRARRAARRDRCAARRRRPPTCAATSTARRRPGAAGRRARPAGRAARR